MQTWITSISRAALMGLAWAAAWLPLSMAGGVYTAGELEPEHIGGALYTAFPCGLLFSVLAGIAAGRNRLDDLSPFRAAAWGAVAGAFVGVLPFVLGEGKVTNYSSAWNTAIVALASLAAALVASRGWLGGLSPLRAAVVAAMVTGLLTGVRAWFQSYPDAQRYLPLAVIGVLCVTSAVSACLSPSVFRWFKKQNASATA